MIKRTILFLFKIITSGNLISFWLLQRTFQQINHAYEHQKCTSLTFNLPFTQNALLTSNQLNDYLAEQFAEKKLTDQPIGKISLHQLHHPFDSISQIQHLYIYKTWGGKVCFQIFPHKPLARTFYTTENTAYLTTLGTLVAPTKKPLRLPLITGTSHNKIKRPNYLSKLLALLQFIQQDKFWKAQIPHIHILENGNLVFYPQVSKQKIEFGKPIHISEKFKKLALLYKKILPYKGWNRYKRVNIQFENQIVCE